MQTQKLLIIFFLIIFLISATDNVYKEKFDNIKTLTEAVNTVRQIISGDGKNEYTRLISDKNIIISIKQIIKKQELKIKNNDISEIEKNNFNEFKPVLEEICNSKWPKDCFFNFSYNKNEYYKNEQIILKGFWLSIHIEKENKQIDIPIINLYFGQI